jgi:acyl-ACP thioesterase
MNKAQVKAKDKRRERREIEEFQMQGAKYALRVYREAVQIVMGLGDKRLARIDEKFMELLHYDEEMQRRKFRANLNTRSFR